MKSIVQKRISVLCKPFNIDEIEENGGEIDYFSPNWVWHKWLHAIEFGIVDYDEEKGIYKENINFTHFAYFGDKDFSGKPSSVIEIDESCENFGDALTDILDNEDYDVEKNSHEFNFRMGIAYQTFYDSEEGFIEGYNDWFSDENIVCDSRYDNGGEISIDSDELENYNIKTFMGYKVDYVVFDYSDKYVDNNGKLNVINFLEESKDEDGTYIDKGEVVGYGVTKIDDDDDDDDEDDDENNLEEIGSNCENNNSKLSLDKILNIKNIFPENMCKIRFLTQSKSFNAVNDYINNPEEFNTVHLFYKFSKKELFNIGDIVLGFLRIENDIWLLTTAKKVTNVLGISNGQNYEGEEIEELKPFFGRLKVFYHNKVQTLVRYYDGLCDEIIVHSLLPEKFKG